MGALLFSCGIIGLVIVLCRIESNSVKAREKKLEQEWVDLKLGSPAPRQRPEVGPFTEAHLRDKGYSEREIEFMMHNFGDQNAAD